MDGLVFYWVGWMLWVIITFMMAKNKYRNYLGMCILTLLALSQTEITLHGLHINIALFVLLFSSMILLSSFPKWGVSIIKSLCLLLGYAGVLFWEQISPVWLFIPRNILLPIIGLVVIIFLAKNPRERLAICCLGITSGEVVHSLVLNSYGINESIGDMAFFDLLFTSIAGLVLITYLIEVRLRLNNVVELLEKQKRRWTQ